jgi:hypothetical protein
MACPYLARPGARRGAAAQAVGLSAQRGDARGDGGAVAGFGRYQYKYDPESAPLFRFADLVEFLGHDLGAEHLHTLLAEIATCPAPPDTCPDYLLRDEEAAERHASGLWYHRHRSVTQS